MIRTLLAIISLLLLVQGGARAQEQYMLGYAGFAGFQASMWAVERFWTVEEIQPRWRNDLEFPELPARSRHWSATVSSSLTSTPRVISEP